MPLPRRRFLAASAASAAALGLGAHAAPTAASAPRAPHREGKGKTLLVLGGTGFLGPHVVQAALDRGWTVTLFNRGRTNADLFPDLEKLVGDRDPDEGDGLSALAGERRWDYVYDTSSYYPRVTTAACELLRDRVERYCLISTISVYSDFETPEQDETAPVATLEDPTVEEVTNATYGALKALCEQAAEAAMPGRVVHARPGLIVGPRDNTDRFTYWPLRVRAGGRVLAPGSIDDPVQYVDARDLAEFTLDCLAEGHTGVFNATGPDAPGTIADLVYGCKAVTGGDATFEWASEAELAELGVRGWTDLPVWAGDSGLSRIDVGRAVAAGFRSRPLAETVADTLAWWDAERADTRRRGSLSAEREAEALAALDALRAGEAAAPAEPGAAGSAGSTGQ